MSRKVRPQSSQMTASERSSKQMIETRSSVSYRGRCPSVCSTLLSFIALLVSTATLVLVALFYFQFQSLTEIKISTKTTYTPLQWLTTTDLEKYDTFLFDVDGTLKNSDGYVPGSREFILQLRAKNKTVIIVSNSDWSTPEDRAKSLAVGIDASNVVIPLTVLSHFEGVHLQGRRILALAPPPVMKWLTDAGATILNNHWNHTRGETTSVAGILEMLKEKPEIVLIDSYNDYDMETVDRIANILAQPEVKFYMLSTDAAWRGEQNLIFSDGGSYYEALKLITGREATGFGKPSYNLNRYMRENFDLTNALMFGDNLNTDFLTANELTIDSCLMIGTGVHNEIDWRRYYEGGDLTRRPSYKGSFVQLAGMAS